MGLSKVTISLSVAFDFIMKKGLPQYIYSNIFPRPVNILSTKIGVTLFLSLMSCRVSLVLVSSMVSSRAL